MIYRSNLTAPDLQPYFKNTHCRVMPHSMKHDVLSDFSDRNEDDPIFGIYKRCGFWTHDEVAILYNCAQRLKGDWLDIGAHTGWTSAHIVAAGCTVTAIEPMFSNPEFSERYHDNLSTIPWRNNILNFNGRSDEFFSWASDGRKFSGVVIDGDHEFHRPLEDAQGAEKHLNEDGGVILFHDFIGAPVQEGVMYLSNRGFKTRVYWTPHLVALCWRGEFNPPDHVRDESIDWPSIRLLVAKGFDFLRAV